MKGAIAAPRWCSGERETTGAATADEGLSPGFALPAPSWDEVPMLAWQKASKPPDRKWKVRGHDPSYHPQKHLGDHWKFIYFFGDSLHPCLSSFRTSLECGILCL